jgi:hypothetical protein
MGLACVCCWDLALKHAFARSSGQRPGSRGGKSTEPSLCLMNSSWKLACELECTYSFVRVKYFISLPVFHYIGLTPL